MNFSKIGSIQAIALIVVIILNHIILNLPKNLLDSCGPSTPLNIIFITILLFIFIYIIIRLFNNFKNSDILDVSEFLGGKILKTIIGILFIAYFVIIVATQFRNFSEILKVLYFPKLPISLLLVIFLVFAVIGNKFGANSVMKANLIIVPLVMINLVIAFFCVSGRFVPERALPILGYGIDKTFFSGMSNLFAFTGLAYIYFLPPMLKDRTSFAKVSYISMGISALYLFLSVTTLLFSFADVLSINEISPIYLLVRGANWGRFIQRPDAIFFFGWILCHLSYLTVTIMFMCNVFKKIGNLNSGSPLIYASASLLFIVAILPKGMVEIRFIENYIFKYSTIILLFVICFIILILANLKYKKQISIRERDLGHE